MKPIILRTPWGAFAFDPGDRHGRAEILARQVFATRLFLDHRDRHGHLIEHRDLGSGLVTNVGVQAMANDFNWAAPSGGAINTLKLQNYHAWGTGATAAATTDITVQTLAAPNTTTATTGTQSLQSAANSAKYQSVATITAGGTVAITEWGLHSAAALSVTTGTPLTAAAAASATVTATPYTASTATVQGEQGLIIITGTTAAWGLILSNTTSVLTIPAWYKTSDGTVSATPGNTEAFTLRPILWDHRVFAALNLVLNDTVAFTYQLTINSGG